MKISKIDNDKLLSTIDSTINYSRFLKLHTRIVWGFLGLGAAFIVFNLFWLGMVSIWISVVCKLLGYKHGILSDYESKNTIEKITLEKRKKNLFFFFWLIPVLSLFNLIVFLSK